MNREAALHYVEEKKGICFVGATALTDLATDDPFTQVSKAKKRQPLATVNLRIASLIIEGEPSDTAPAGTAVLLGLAGDAQGLLDAVVAQGWRRSGGRYLHTSGDALILS